MKLAMASKIHDSRLCLVTTIDRGARKSRDEGFPK